VHAPSYLHTLAALTHLTHSINPLGPSCLPLGTSIPDFVLDLVNVSFEEDPGLLKVGGWAIRKTS